MCKEWVRLCLVGVLVAVGLSAVPADGLDVTIDASTRYQTIEGWGACAGMEVLTSDSRARDAYRDLGCNLLRVAVEPCLLMDPAGDLYGPFVDLTADLDANAAKVDWEHSRTDHWDEVASWLTQNALEPGRTKVVLSCWSPPNWSKAPTGAYVDTGYGAGVTPFIAYCNECDSVGGTWDDGTYGWDASQYCSRYLAAVCRAFEQHAGVQVYGLSIQNEVAYENPFNSCTLYHQARPDKVEAETVMDYGVFAWALNAVRAELTQHPSLSDIQIMGPHNANVGQSPDNPWALLFQMEGIRAVKEHSDPTLIDYLHIYTHNYSADAAKRAEMFRAYWEGSDSMPDENWATWTYAPGIDTDGKQTWNSEFGGHDPSYTGALDLAGDLHCQLAWGNESAIIHWAFCEDSLTVHNLVATGQLDDPQASPKYSAFKQFSRYVRPGAERVRAVFADGSTSYGTGDPMDAEQALNVSAYVHDTDGRVTIVLVNMRTDQYSLDITVPANPNVTTYNVYRTTSGNYFAQLADVNVSGGQVSVTVPGESIVTLTGTGGGGDTTPPAAPTGLSATGYEGYVALDWNDNTEPDLGSYRVYRDTSSGGPYSQIASGVASSDYTDGAVAAGTTYYYVVTAVDTSNNESSSSTEASAAPLGDSTPPAAPTGLGATAGDGQVTLDWNDNGEADLDGYRVYRSTTSGSGYSQVADVSSSAHTDTGLTNGTTYYYVVTAYDTSNNESGYSSEVAATPQGGTYDATVVQATAAPSIDGSIDGVWAGANSYTIANALSGSTGGSDLSGSWRGLWDSTNLYYLAEVTDESLVNDSANAWDDDSVEIYIDADNSKGTSYDGVNDFQYVFRYNDSTVHVGSSTPDNTVGIVFDIVAVSGGYVAEISIPWTTLGVTPAQGNLIGTDVHVNDDDDGAERDGKIAWYATEDNSWTDPSTFATADLGGTGGPTVPNAPSGLSATATGTTTIDLSWTDNSSDEDGFRIERKTGAGGTYGEIDTVGADVTTYGDSGLSASTTYYYRVLAYNTAGDSGYSNEANATTETPPDTTPPDPPTGLGATAGDGQVSLDWNDNPEPDLDGYRVYRSTTSGSGYSQIAGPGSSAYTDSGVTNGTTYYYVVTAYDTSANESGYSNEASATPQDVTAPAAPTGLSATPGDGQVSLDWDDNSEPDLANYRVYRSTTSGSGYSQIASPGSSAYTDSGVTNGTTYYYVVTAVDTASNESGYSSEVSATPASAGAGTGLQGQYYDNMDFTSLAVTRVDPTVNFDWGDGAPDASMGADTFSVRWTAKVEPLYSETYTFRTYTDDGVRLWVDGQLVVENWTDHGPTSDTGTISLTAAVQYDVQLDFYENGGGAVCQLYWSSASQTEEIVPQSQLYEPVADTTPPADPTGLGATAGDAQVSLDWNDNGEGDLDGYRVYRSTTSGSGYSQIADVSSSAHTDTGVTNGTTYYYVVTAYDTSANESGYSNEASATPQDVTAPAAPTGLGATAGDAQVTLDWNDNSEGDLDGYRVYRSTTSGSGYSQIASPSSSAHTDSGVTNGTTYYYVVTAYDTSNNESGYSNEASATPQAGGAGTTTYNFVGVTQSTADYNAYACDVDVFPFGGSSSNRNSQVEATNTQYTSISADNTAQWATADPGYNDEVFLWLEMKINESAGNITQIDLTFNGNTDGSAATEHRIYVMTAGADWVQSSSWTQVGTGQSIPQDVDTTMTRSITSSVSNYIDGSGNIVWGVYETRSSEDLRINYVETVVHYSGGDTTPPAAPTGLSATAVSESQIDLDWNDNAEPDLSGYRVYRSTTSGSGYSQVASPSSSAYADTGLSASTTYYYVVTAVDTSSNESGYSGEASATTQTPPDTTPPDPPTGLSATAGEGQVSLDWNDNGEGDLDGYRVYRSTTSGSGYGQIADVSSSAHTDTGLTNGTTYYYVVTAYDTSANESGYSNEVSATPQDVTAPAAPTGLTAASGDGQVGLDWNDNGEGDLSGYRVYRSTTSGSGYSQIASPSASAYTDTGLTNGTAYYYVVTAVDTSSNESGYSNEASATPQAGGAPGELLTWDFVGEGGASSSTADAFGTNVSTSAPSGVASVGAGLSPIDYLSDGLTATQSTAMTLAEALAAEDYFTWSIAPTAGNSMTLTRVEIRPVSQNRTRTFVLFSSVGGFNEGSEVGSFDESANMNAPIHTVNLSGHDNLSGQVEFRLYVYGYTDVYESVGMGNGDGYDLMVYGSTTGGGDTTPPAAPTGLSATAVSTSQIDLDWNDNTEPDLSGYRAYRSTTSGSGYSQVAGPSSSAYSDTGLSASTTYYYVVTAVDTSSNESGYSNEASATTDTTPDTTPPDPPTGLSAVAGEGQVSLDWNDNTEPDLDGYRVYRSTTSGGSYSQIANPSSSAYTDSGVTNGTTYYYVVTAYDTSANESGYSNEASATPQDVTAPAAPTSLSATAGDGSVALDWNDNGEGDLDGYRVYRSTTSGSGYSQIASPSSSAYTDSGVTNGTTYYYVVTAYDTSNNESGYSSEVSATPQSTGLPAPWVSSDVGSVGQAGSATYAAGTFTIDGGGADIWGTADEFHFVYQTLSGDGEVQARVASVENTNSWAKAGVTIRAALTAGSAHAMAVVTPGNGVAFQRRTSTDGSSTHTAGSSSTAPRWVRLVRSGSTFTGYESSDGSGWTEIGSATISMGADVYVGLCVTSHDDSTLCTAEIGSVTVGGGGPDVTPPAAPTGLDASAGDGQVSLDWNDNGEGDLDGYRVYRSTTSGSGYGQIADVSSSAHTDTGLTNGTTYYYVVTAYDTSDNESGYSGETSATPTGGGGGSGTILREWWTDISGTTVPDLTGSANYPDSPSGSDEPTSFEAPTDWADNYGTRMRGYVHPPATGSYTFYIASDDSSELWLSTDDSPANAALIANVDGWTSSREWTKYTSQTSSAVSLTAGQQYYVEALQKEGGGGDNLAVAWTGPGIASITVIDGQYLSPWVAGPDTTPPAAPTGLTAGGGDGQVSLNWADNGESDLAGYRVYRSTTSGSGYSQIASPGASAYTDNGVTNGTTYYYVVTAYDTSDNESGYSTEASATPQAGGGPTGLPLVGMGLNGMSYWNVSDPFVEVSRIGDAWISFDPDGPDWDDGRTFPVDSNGYPTSLAADQAVRTLVFTHNGGYYPTGDYVLTWDGDGEISLEGTTKTIVSDDPGRRVVNIPSTGGNGIFLTIFSTNPSDHIRNINLWLPGYENSLSIFNPILKDNVAPWGVLRFMDWGATNGSPEEHWADRCKPADAHYGGSKGVPYEVMVDLCNEMDKDMWVCVPHMATDDYVTQLAILIRDRLESGRRVWIEYSNEVWNWQFEQAQYNLQRANDAGVDYPTMYARRSCEIFDIFQAQFGGLDRMIRVIAGQAGYGGGWVLQQALIEAGSNVDVGSIASYFTGSGAEDLIWSNLGTITMAEVFNYIDNEIVTTVRDQWLQNVQHCDARGLPMVAYEGGPHLVARTDEQRNSQEFVDFLADVNRNAGMYNSYQLAMNQWKNDIGASTWVAFVESGGWSQWGYWGHKEYGSQPVSEATKFRAVQDWLNAQ